ncbi:MAG: NmrA/HSCARG family protein, partial [Candidatus Krumholzibacteria bacterium]|nr:NmrA/HSCARG family protein [Candidatus Krumholzibacteria bacterium]
MTRAFGREVVHAAVSPQTYRGFGFPGAEDLGNMFQFKRDFEREFCGRRDVALSRELNPRLQTFAQWLERNKHRIPLEAAAAQE